MLRQAGAQKRITNTNGSVNNTYTNSNGTEYYPQPDNIALGGIPLTAGAFSENTYTAVYGFFQSRGASTSNAAVMASITMDVARMENVSPWSIIEASKSQLNINLAYYTSLNVLRGAGDQQQRMTNINNAKSLVSRSIMA
jgi:hypothetical protein